MGNGQVSQGSQCQGQGKVGQGHGHGQGQCQVQGQVQGLCNQRYRRGAGAITYASPESLWLAEILSGRKGFVSGHGRRGITLLHARLKRGGGILCRWQRTLLVAVAEAKRGVDTNCEEV